MQVWDSGKWFCWNTGPYVRIYSTSKKQIYDLIDCYVGPSYLNFKHRKYSEMLNVTYVTMLYGLGLPMLFPIAFFTYFMYYTVERYQIAYTHQMPPAMDDMMTQNALRKLSYAPILFLFNGYWMLSNT